MRIINHPSFTKINTVTYLPSQNPLKYIIWIQQYEMERKSINKKYNHTNIYQAQQQKKKSKKSK